MRFAFLFLLPLTALLSACVSGSSPRDGFQAAPSQGQYVRPDWLSPAPTPQIQPIDLCRSQLYTPLVGASEGAIYIPGLPGMKRIIRPAVFEGPDNDFLNGEMMADTYVEVQTYLPGQQLYAPSIADVSDRITIIDDQPARLTIELDREGYVQEIRCG